MTRNDYELVIVEYHNGEGALVYAVGWDFGPALNDDDEAVRQLCTVLEKRTSADWVPGPIVEVPCDAIIDVKIVRKELPVRMRR